MTAADAPSSREFCVFDFPGWEACPNAQHTAQRMRGWEDPMKSEVWHAWSASIARPKLFIPNREVSYGEAHSPGELGPVEATARRIAQRRGAANAFESCWRRRKRKSLHRKWAISSRIDLHQGEVEEETRVVAFGTSFQPDEIKLMRSVLDEAAIILPEAERTSPMKAKLASRILAAAAKGERDPNKLRIAALLDEMDV
jgi:hypothetical protein